MSAEGKSTSGLSSVGEKNLSNRDDQEHDNKETEATIVNGYLASLGIDRDRVPDLNLLTDIVRKHVATFAFSSVSVQLGDDMTLEFEALYDRIVSRRRGGYCFEHNGLLFEILTRLGFEVKLQMSRVIIRDALSHPGLCHRVNFVTLEGNVYLVDVAFSSAVPRVPVLMQNGEITKDGARSFRIIELKSGSGEYHLQILKDTGPVSFYRFELVRYGQADVDVGHFFSHKHPNAVFVKNSMVTLSFEHEVRSYLNGEYRINAEDGTLMSTKVVSSSSELREILVKQLGLTLTIGETERLYAQEEVRRKEKTIVNA
jgi:N-hydroxyarylamine O-acetyltransferase